MAENGEDALNTSQPELIHMLWNLLICCFSLRRKALFLFFSFIPANVMQMSTFFVMCKWCWILVGKLSLKDGSVKSATSERLNPLPFDGLNGEKNPGMSKRDRYPPVLKSLIARGPGCDPEAGARPGWHPVARGDIMIWSQPKTAQADGHLEPCQPPVWLWHCHSSTWLGYRDFTQTHVCAQIQTPNPPLWGKNSGHASLSLPRRTAGSPQFS